MHLAIIIFLLLFFLNSPSHPLCINFQAEKSTCDNLYFKLMNPQLLYWLPIQGLISITLTTNKFNKNFPTNTVGAWKSMICTNFWWIIRLITKWEQHLFNCQKKKKNLNKIKKISKCLIMMLDMEDLISIQPLSSKVQQKYSSNKRIGDLKKIVAFHLNFNSHLEYMGDQISGIILNRCNIKTRKNGSGLSLFWILLLVAILI